MFKFIRNYIKSNPFLCLWFAFSTACLMLFGVTAVSELFTGLLFLYLAGALFFLVDRSTKLPDPDTPGRVLGNIEETISRFFELVISIVAGVVLAGLAAGKNESDVLNFADDLTAGITVGAVLFLVQVLGKSTTVLSEVRSKTKELQKAVSDLETSNERTEEAAGFISNIAETAQDSFAHGGYAALAAQVLDLKQHPFQESNGAANQEAPAALSAGVGNVSAAATTARRIGGDEDSVTEAARRAWWGFLKTYFQEEMYDISNFEVATNVRNYAYTIISVISALQSALKEQGNSRLVIVNVSQFNPKDFYNWPSGTPDHRFYHEAEFFALYRRVFSKLVRSQESTIPLRIVLAAKARPAGVGRAVGESEKRRNLGLGWTTDIGSFIAQDLATYRVLPVPLIQPSRERDSIPKGTIVDSLQPKEPTWLPNQLTSNSKETLNRQTDRILVTPMVQYSNDAITQEFVQTAKRWDQNLDTQSITKDLDELATTQRRRLAEYPESMWHVALRKLYHVLATASPNEKGADKKFKNTLARWVKSMLKREVGSEKAARRQLKSQISQTTLPRQISAELLDAVAIIAHETLATFEESKSNSRICHVLDASQSADAKLRLIGTHQGCSETVEGSRTCFGTKMGPFEEWTLFFALHAYAEVAVRRHGTRPIPLWKMFARDFLGIDKDSDGIKTSAKEFESYSPRMLNRVRICELERTGNKSADSNGSASDDISDVEYFHKNGISSEFVMFGIAPDGGDIDIDAVKPLMLLSTSLSEPFHACKMRLKIAQSNKPDDPVSTHWDWVKKVFSEREDETESWLKSIHEYLSAGNTE